MEFQMSDILDYNVYLVENFVDMFENILITVFV